MGRISTLVRTNIHEEGKNGVRMNVVKIQAKEADGKQHESQQ